jgi:hypothetical protein
MPPSLLQLAPLQPPGPPAAPTLHDVPFDCASLVDADVTPPTPSSGSSPVRLLCLPPWQQQRRPATWGCAMRYSCPSYDCSHHIPPFFPASLPRFYPHLPCLSPRPAPAALTQGAEFFHLPGRPCVCAPSICRINQLLSCPRLCCAPCLALPPISLLPVHAAAGCAYAEHASALLLQHRRPRPPCSVCTHLILAPSSVWLQHASLALPPAFFFLLRTFNLPNLLFGYSPSHANMTRSAVAGCGRRGEGSSGAGAWQGA